MSDSPRQNFWNPPPVPEIPTVTFVPGVARWKSSATASLMGNTVLDPSTRTRPPVEPGVPDAVDSGPLEHPATASPATSIQAHHERFIAVIWAESYRAADFVPISLM
jgi:hypothetical protein